MSAAATRVTSLIAELMWTDEDSMIDRGFCVPANRVKQQLLARIRENESLARQAISWSLRKNLATQFNRFRLIQGI
jgi:hypothetical protein